ncbi:3-hydroxyacyl-ACP dehydratase FabZ family protein [Sandaracinus amylolyticus]|uniref:3-hydroxyacyl-[acyl-carrier-protein] dehydratase n=1 Tax=Sandaracinus amylolyticus TaxID=927083 RepID=A0A0F6SDY7_9BACT|nr:hypothetical protein [Sandaracinus amylolyticus]AKF04264.1 3-hydroxyacyl-[acyl-carrier-protein] dehydratase [Sandaracinus amylolyticus]
MIELEPLKLGADVVQMLLPHRRPFLFVDATIAITLRPRPALRAVKLVSANEPVFEGHFPGVSLWPGVYTIEGLGQTINLLDVIDFAARELDAGGTSPAALLDALRAIDARARLGGRPPSAIETQLLDGLGAPRARIGFAGAIDVKLIEPVFAGSMIEYRVTRTHELANARRYDVEARVADRPVARGTMTSATP